jgi:hypothetical protein
MPGTSKIAHLPLYRCAAPNCGVLKYSNERCWLMWTSFAEFDHPVLYLGPWDEEVATREGTLHVCGESCAQKIVGGLDVEQNLAARGGWPIHSRSLRMSGAR